MNIKEIKIEEFERIRNELIELQYQNSCIHYPHKEIDKETQTKPMVDSIKQYLQEGKAFLFVAMQESEVIGFLWCYPKEYLNEYRIYINSLIVSETFRGKKVGSLLMERAEKKAQSLNCDCVYVSTTSTNEPAIQFYKKHNYEEERIQLVKKIKSE